MPSNIDKLTATLKFLNLAPHMQEYRWRFLAQKIAFLAKALGMNISYDFTIYVAGPYSRELNCDYYPDEIKDHINSLQTNYKLTPTEKMIATKIQACNDILENQGIMEATSTAVFSLKQNPQLSEDDLFTMLKRLKPHLTDSDKTIGITRAKELLFKPEYMTEEMRREMDEWDRIES
jgi:uncharacterized protein YwgA